MENKTENKTYNQCSFCVMDTSDIDIDFDANGVCNHCAEFLNKRIHYKYKGEETENALQTLISSIKKAGKGKAYDCVLGLSGGVDSSYAAYIAKQNGLRVLGVHLDNGWDSEKSVFNIQNIIKKLAIDYESFVLDWEEFKDMQLAFLKASVPEAETPTDIAILAALHKVANKYGIKYIISGGNFSTEGILPKTWHYDAKDFTYLNYIQTHFGTKKLKKFPRFSFKKEIYYKLVKGINMVYLLNYVNYEKNEAINLLKEKLDWRSFDGKHYESKYTGFIQSYYLYEKFGIDYRRATLSSLICVGEVSREEALQILSEKPFQLEKINEEKKYIAKKLSISLEEFENLISLPPKLYRDYPNDEKKLSFIYDTYRKLFKKEKLGNF